MTASKSLRIEKMRNEQPEVGNEPYMNPQQLAFFKRNLCALREQSLNHLRTAQQRIGEQPELNDEGDYASYEEESRMAIRIVERERQQLNKIDAALERIRNGEYGYCQESGEPIGIPRLLIRPTAEYCTEVKTRMEKRERHYGRR